jgi:hypothetical protein
VAVGFSALCCVFGSIAVAADISLEFELGLGHSDNISREPDTPAAPTQDEVFYSGGLAVTYEEQTAKMDTSVRGSLTYIDYEQAFDSETLPALDASAVFKLTEQSLRWFAYGNVGQQTVDPFSPVTPDNRQNVTYLTTGPSLFLPLGRRFSLTADAWYSDVNYEEQPLDNTRAGAQVGMAREINPTRSLSINVRGERTDFEEDPPFSAIERYDAYLRFETEGSRNEIAVDLGLATAERASNRTEEPLLTFDWRRQMSPSSDFSLVLGSRISDAAEDFRSNQRQSISIGDVQNQQAVTEPFQEDYIQASLRFGRARSNVTIAAGWREQDYDDLVQSNRIFETASINFSRELGNNWSVGLNGQVDRIDYDVLQRDDDDFRIGASLTWRQLRTLELELRVQHFERESTDPLSEFTEFRSFLGFRYIPDL